MSATERKVAIVLAVLLVLVVVAYVTAGGGLRARTAAGEVSPAGHVHGPGCTHDHAAPAAGEAGCEDEHGSDVLAPYLQPEGR